MRPALRPFLPTPTERRRNRTLATLTAVAAAAGIAAVAATSSEDDVSPAASGDAVAHMGPGTSQGEGFSLPGIDLAPRSDTSSPIEPPIGDVQRLSDQQQLPSLSSELEAVPDVTTTSVMDTEDDAADDDAADDDAGDDDPAAAGGLEYETADGELIDAERISAFLDGRNAPLAAHAATIVAAGVEHDVDPRVVVAIAIAESNGAEMKPSGTHNAWGWGGSGPRGLRAWDSWEESIDDFTERLGSLYDTDNVDWDFASTYCPPNTQWWYDTVTWAIGEI